MSINRSRKGKNFRIKEDDSTSDQNSSFSSGLSRAFLQRVIFPLRTFLRLENTPVLNSNEGGSLLDHRQQIVLNNFNSQWKHNMRQPNWNLFTGASDYKTDFFMRFNDKTTIHMTKHICARTKYSVRIVICLQAYWSRLLNNLLSEEFPDQWASGTATNFACLSLLMLAVTIATTMSKTQSLMNLAIIRVIQVSLETLTSRL